jgi:septal ring factor EnvC (AmiA/AmiB activator)
MCINFFKSLASFIKIHTKFLLLIVLLVFINGSIYGQKTSQKRKELEAKRKELQLKIEENKKRLAETKKEESNSLKQLNVLGMQIKTREQMIDHIGQETFELSIEIEGQKRAVLNLENDLVQLKEDYAKNILAAYKKRNFNDQLMFVFDSKNFFQAFRRIKYLNQYGRYRLEQSKLILKTQKSIIEAINEMIAIKNQKMDLMGLKESEKKELEIDKKEETNLLEKLQFQVSNIKGQIVRQERMSNLLNKAIGELIQKEIAEARKAEELKRKAEEAKRLALAKKSNSKPEPQKQTTTNSYLSSSELALSKNFEDNKGKLPWPVDAGNVVGRFGTHEHPELKGVMVKNNGVDIKTILGAEVKCVFKGEVVRCFTIPGLDNVVLVNHGEYYSVYARLENIKVKKGQQLNASEGIGTLSPNESENHSLLHFEIYKQTNLQDPSKWLR